MSQLSYDAHNHASPFLDGKKNSTFVHPNLRSSNIFYDHDYAYKNDLPNPRLLTSVKNDRFSTPRDDRVMNRSAYDSTPPPKSERGTSFYSANKPSATEANEADSSLSRGQRGSVPNLRLGNESRGGNNRDQDLYVINEDAGLRSAKFTRSNQGPGKYCLDCVNSSLAHKQRCKKDNEKVGDDEHMRQWVATEKKKAAYNYDKDRQERVIKKKEQQESQIHAAHQDYVRVYGKEEPVIEGGIVIDAIFDKHDERSKKNSAAERSLRGYNFDKMVDSQVSKERERLDRLTSTHNSLQVGETHVNKYLPASGTVIKDIEKQMESNADRKAQERYAEQRLDRELLEANQRALEKEKQAKKEKVESYQRMLTDQMNAKIQQKELDKEQQKVDKQKAKYFAEQTVEDHKAKEMNKDLNNKKNKEMFMNSLKEHQIESSYRKKFEQKKQHLEGNGVTLKLGTKPELDNCAGCNKLKDKNHLTHYKH